MIEPIINAKDCSVQERSVNIRVLTVGTKQITHALYQQLIEDYRSLIADDEDGGIIKPDANIWGWVNVCTPECKKTIDKHYHVVYETNGNLKKARVSCALFGPDTFGRDWKDEMRRTLDPQRKAELQQWIKEYETSWKEALKTIEGTGQLFIAVSGVWK
jgi:hypothetical protein